MNLSPATQTRIALVLAALTYALLLSWWWGHWAPDLSAIYFAARLWHDGQPGEIYASSNVFFGSVENASWANLRTALGHKDEVVFAYVYPPLWAALIAPVAGAMGPMAFFNLAAALQIAMICAMPFLAWDIAGRPGGRLPFAAAGLVLAATAEPSLAAQFLMQPQITVAFLVLLAFQRLAAGREVAAGMVLGLAAALKLSPLIFVLLFLPGRHWRGLAACLGTAAALGALSLAIAGIDLHRAFLAQVRLISGMVPFDQVNWSLRPVLVALGEAAGLIAPIPAVQDSPNLGVTPSWLALAMPAVLAAGLAILWLATRGMAEPRALAARLASLAILAALTGPLGWNHHYLLPLMLVPALLAALAPRTALILLILLTFALSPIFGPSALVQPSGIGHLAEMAPALLPMLVFIALAVAFPAVLRRAGRT